MPGNDNNPSPWTVVNDYTKTVITVAAALLAFTGTFSTSDRMAAAPVWLLFLSWILLVVAIAASLFSVGRLTGFLKNGKGSYSCLLAANISYFALFAAVLAFLLFAIIATRKKSDPPTQAPSAAAATGTVKLVEVGSSIPPFASGFASGPPDQIVTTICGAREMLQQLGSPTAIVIGHYDRTELSRRAERRFESNAGLAQQRADWIGGLLQDRGLCTAAPVMQVLTTIGGPRKTNLELNEDPADAHKALAEDRRVEVEGLQYVSVSSKPATKEPAK